METCFTVSEKQEYRSSYRDNAYGEHHELCFPPFQQRYAAHEKADNKHVVIEQVIEGEGLDF